MPEEVLVPLQLLSFSSESSAHAAAEALREEKTTCWQTEHPAKSAWIRLGLPTGSTVLRAQLDGVRATSPMCFVSILASSGSGDERPLVERKRADGTSLTLSLPKEPVSKICVRLDALKPSTFTIARVRLWRAATAEEAKLLRLERENVALKQRLARTPSDPDSADALPQKARAPLPLSDRMDAPTQPLSSMLQGVGPFWKSRGTDGAPAKATKRAREAPSRADGDAMDAIERGGSAPRHGLHAHRPQQHDDCGSAIDLESDGDHGHDPPSRPLGADVLGSGASRACSKRDPPTPCARFNTFKHVDVIDLC